MNNKKKILIIGANGFLGKNIFNVGLRKYPYYEKFSYLAADLVDSHIPPEIPFHYMDITNYEQVKKKILKIHPDIIILTAAMTNVDNCEKEKDLAAKINITGPKNVATVSSKVSAKLLFISTDFVFDGKKKGGYKEEDPPNPLNFYAETKYQAELAIKKQSTNYLICRTAVLYGWNPYKLNFITWILDQLSKDNKISIVITQKNSPTFVENLANILLKLIEKEAEGIYHTAGSEILSRYEMAVKTAKIFDLDGNLINPIEKINQLAKRPLNAGLDVSKLKQIIDDELKIFNLKEGLKYMKHQAKKTFKREV